MQHEITPRNDTRNDNLLAHRNVNGSNTIILLKYFVGLIADVGRHSCDRQILQGRSSIRPNFSLAEGGLTLAFSTLRRQDTLFVYFVFRMRGVNSKMGQARASKLEMNYA